MTATHNGNCSTPQGVLYLAFELGWTEWKLAFTTGHGQKPRFRSMRARDLPKLQQEIARAKERFGLAAEAVVRVHRKLAVQGKAAPCERLQRCAVAPVEREKAARLAGRPAREARPLDDCRLDPAAAEEIRGRGADHPAAADHNMHHPPSRKRPILI